MRYYVAELTDRLTADIGIQKLRVTRYKTEEPRAYPCDAVLSWTEAGDVVVEYVCGLPYIVRFTVRQFDAYYPRFYMLEDGMAKGDVAVPRYCLHLFDGDIGVPEFMYVRPSDVRERADVPWSTPPTEIALGRMYGPGKVFIQGMVFKTSDVPDNTKFPCHAIVNLKDGGHVVRAYPDTDFVPTQLDIYDNVYDPLLFNNMPDGHETVYLPKLPESLRGRHIFIPMEYCKNTYEKYLRELRLHQSKKSKGTETQSRNHEIEILFKQYRAVLSHMDEATVVNCLRSALETAKRLGGNN